MTGNTLAQTEVALSFQSSSPVLCLYHAGCPDGLTAAWIVKSVFPQAECLPVEHGYPPPSVLGRNVILVDFCYPRLIMLEIAKHAENILVIDHHASVRVEMRDFLVQETMPQDHQLPSWAQTLQCLTGRLAADEPVIALVFDTQRSGAGMAWDFFYPNEQRPLIVNHVEDVDLKKNQIKGSTEVLSGLVLGGRDLASWESSIKRDIQQLSQDGGVIESYRQQEAFGMLKSTWRQLIIAGYIVPVGNFPFSYFDLLAEAMLDDKDADFCACYLDTNDYREFRLRSAETGIDVSEVAKTFGGGGHAHAAGFRVPREHLLARS